MLRSNRLYVPVLAALGLIALFCAVPRLAAARQHAPAKVRIGTYDSRAVAIAWARSAMNAEQLNELRARHGEAKAAGNDKLAKELEEQGKSRQVRMHLQGFSNAPVDDILNHVRDELAPMAAGKDLVAITASADWADAAVELVDVTDELVGLFGPDQQTLKIIAELREQKPLPIEEIAKMPADH